MCVCVVSVWLTLLYWEKYWWNDLYFPPILSPTLTSILFCGGGEWVGAQHTLKLSSSIVCILSRPLSHSVPTIHPPTGTRTPVIPSYVLFLFLHIFFWAIYKYHNRGSLLLLHISGTHWGSLLKPPQLLPPSTSRRTWLTSSTEGFWAWQFKPFLSYIKRKTENTLSQHCFVQGTFGGGGFPNQSRNLSVMCFSKSH